MEVATGAIAFLLPKVGVLLSDQDNFHKRVRKDIEFLSAEMASMEAALLKVAEVPSDQLDVQVKLWAEEVRQLSYEIEDSIDRFMVRSLEDDSDPDKFKRLVKKTVDLFKKGKAREFADAIVSIKEQMREVAERRGRIEDAVEVAERRGRIEDAVEDAVATWSTVDWLAISGEPVGVQEAICEKIEMLMSDGGNNQQQQQQQLKILSIVGPGGLGKTTVAKAVYTKMQTQFDCTALVSVGHNPDLKKVFKDILLQIDKEKYSDFSAEAVEMCIEEIRELLQNKRYFLIYDDIWDTQAWEVIRFTLPENNFGSRVITTTRIYSVALNAGDVYKLEPLSHDDSEKLFYKRVFGDKFKLPDEQTTRLIQKFLQKCGGLPLAIITIANLLSSTPNEDWYKVYNSISSGAANENGVEHIRNVISSSYYDLPIYLRACLLHLSIFPEGYMVRKDALIWMWVAEGFIQNESGVGLFEIGERYFHELINRSLIQPVKTSHSGGIIGCRVHDMILDMICFIAHKKSFATILNSNEQQHTPMKFKSRRLSLHKEFVGHQYPLATDHLSRVRSFNAFMCHATMMPSLERFKVLRVLAIEGCSFQSEGNAYFLNPIGDLHHLRYLGLWKTPVHELPECVGKLTYLEILDLRQTGIRELPNSVGLLQRLKCLRADGGSTRVPDWIGNLTSLEELSLNDVSSSSNFVKEVSKLKELRELKVWIRWLDERSKKALVKSLGSLQKIQVLHLDGGLWLEDAEWEGYVPPRQLRCLSLRTKSSRLPRWIKDSFLPNLSHLSVDVRVLEAEDLKILGSFPKLMTLELFVPTSVSLYVECHPGSAFPKLSHCYASGMLSFLKGAAPRLESVHFNVRLSTLNGASFQFGFLGNLPLLMEVRVEIFHSDMEVEEALRLAVEVHSNRPTLHVSKYELSFDELDTEKEEDNVELEEDDWYSPTANAM